jgi:LytR cell envelope-related transcriptional attenuator
VLHLIDTVGTYVAIPAVLGILLVLPLYLSQRRDLARLRDWMEREPGHPAADIVSSEATLDRAETELESILGVPRPAAVFAQAPGPPTLVAPPSAGAAPPATGGVTPIPPAQRVTAERPALERITMERAALEPHPRWRRFGSRLTRPRTLIIIALVAVTLGVAALIGSRELLHTDEGGGKGGRHHHAVATGPSGVKVAVLNGTSRPGLAAPVVATLNENGFQEGAISTTRKAYQQTVVMYGGGEKKAAEKVARVLGVKPVQRIDKTTRAIAGSADVVVIAGADRTRH